VGKAKAKPAKLPALSATAVQYGAMYLATSNLGFETDTKGPGEVTAAWRRCKQAHDCDNVDCLPELQEWAALLRKGDKYSVETVLHAMPWLAGVGY